MARSGRPWAVVVATVVSALVAAGALGTAAVLRHVPAGASTPGGAPPSSESVGADGCLVRPCQLLRTEHAAGTAIALVADSGAKSGRLQIGGGGASAVIEVTITEQGATLTDQSLQCVPSALTVCVVRGVFGDGVIAQVVVGRSQEWHSLGRPIASDAGFLVVAEVTGAHTGAEIVAAQHNCVRSEVADCSVTPVFLQVYSGGTGELIGCSRDYARLASLPGWPNPNLADEPLRPCA